MKEEENEKKKMGDERKIVRVCGREGGRERGNDMKSWQRNKERKEGRGKKC